MLPGEVDMRRKRNWTWYILAAGIGAAAVFFLIPVGMTFARSFRVSGRFSLEGYQELLFNCFPFYRLFWNSVIYSTLITAGCVLLSVLAAFAFHFAHFPGKKALYVLYIVLMMMPLQVMILPNYIGLRDFGLLNTPAAIVLPLIFSPMGTVIIKQYLEGCNTEVVEAARLETNSSLRVIRHCILPQIRVCVCAVALFLFAEAWNLVEQPMLYVNEDSMRTLSAMFSETEHYHDAVLSPASVLFMAPVLLWYLLYHRELQEGLKR